MQNLYQDGDQTGVPYYDAPVEEFLVWRDLRVFDGKIFCSIISTSIEIFIFEKQEHRCLRSQHF